jgi:hypothetical protein
MTDNRHSLTMPLVDRLPAGWAELISKMTGEKYSRALIYQVVSQGIRSNDEVMAAAHRLATIHYDAITQHLTNMKVYVTGSIYRDEIEQVASAIRERGIRVVTPYDVLMEGVSESDALKARLAAVIECSEVVTTAPNKGEWSAAADKELRVARVAGIPVVPCANYKAA